MVHPGNTRIPFHELVRLERIDESTFRSIAAPFAPGDEDGVGRAYGGHVYAQAAWAACYTVKTGFLIHSVAGSFLLGGLITVPYVYKVHTIRDGRSFCTRIVNVTQAQEQGICFTCTISFKTAEDSLLDMQERANIWDKYAVVLAGQKPLDFPFCPGMDVPWFVKRREEFGINDEFPGLDMPKVDMRPYNSARHPLDRRQLTFYRPVLDLPLDPNLHLCAHLYASDRNGLYNVANLFDMGDVWTSMGSLTHYVVFHASLDDLMFRASTLEERSPQDDVRGRWFVKDDNSDRVTDGRMMYHSKAYAPNGVHIASFMQDGMMRLSKKPTPTPHELDTIRARVHRYKAREKL